MKSLGRGFLEEQTDRSVIPALVSSRTALGGQLELFPELWMGTGLCRIPCPVSI